MTHRSRVEAMLADAAARRADALVNLAEAIGGAPLSAEVRARLVEHPLPLADGGMAGVAALRAAYEAQERAALAIAARLDQ
jgi:hypothetical protein